MIMLLGAAFRGMIEINHFVSHQIRFMTAFPQFEMLPIGELRFGQQGFHGPEENPSSVNESKSLLERLKMWLGSIRPLAVTIGREPVAEGVTSCRP
jgi:hypothetical protein